MARVASNEDNSDINRKRSSSLPSNIKELLKIPKEELILSEHECFLMRHELIMGKLLLTNNYVCFFDNSQHVPIKLQSYLDKHGDLVWRRRWCVLTNESLTYFESSDNQVKLLNFP